MNPIHAFIGVFIVAFLCFAYQAFMAAWGDAIVAKIRDRRNARRNDGVIVRDYRVKL